AAKYLAEKGKKVVIFERKLAPGGGMWGGGMLFPAIVVQDEALPIMKEFGIKYEGTGDGYYTASSVESVAKLLAGATDAGAKVFISVSIEDVMIREKDKITGLVINWTPVKLAQLHVDPLTIRAKVVIDATGHDADVIHIIQRKIPGAKFNTPTGEILGEKPMWADIGEGTIRDCTTEIYPGLVVCGMAATSVMGKPRMGPIFGGMLISGKRAAEIALKMCEKK
ncbi:MAG: sulfide-dependent adenosine diphosphate thiazole synthase, partial [Candidatus Thermoplasmatota archaeon]|nr:sulfide-dependent adenosine diphosphate thiazole synthase [Candidatus Thermoplasmatota archaeon]